MLKILNREDKQDCMELLEAFFLESPYNTMTYSEDKVSDALEDAFDNKDMIILGYVKDNEVVGIIIGGTISCMFSEDLIANELVWFMKKDHRNGLSSVKLHKAFEYWAKEVKKVSGVVMAHLNDDKVSKYYRKQGYAKREEAYYKEF